MTGRPTLAKGRRRALLGRLMLNGFAQTGLALGLALTFEKATAAISSGATFEQTADLAAILVAGGGGTVLLRTLQRRDAEAVGLDYVRELRAALFRAICRQPHDARQSIGPVMTRFTTDLSSVKNWVSHGVTGSLTAVAALAAGAIALPFIDVRLALASVLPLILCATLAGVFAMPLSKWVRVSRALRGRLSARMGENLLTRTALVHLGLVEREVRRMDDLNAAMNGALIRRALWSGLVRACVEAAVPLAFAGLLLASAAGAFEAPLSAGLLLGWMFALGLVLAPSRDAARALDHWLVHKEAMRRLDTLLAVGGPTESGETPGGGPLTAVGLGVDSDGDAFCATASMGDLVVVVGDAPRRSALIAALGRLNPAPAGSIRLGGVPIETIGTRQFAAWIGMISPRVPLFNGSVRRNLRRGAEDADETRLDEVRALCGLGDALPDGLKTRVSSSVPPALRSRIALARALMRAPKVLLVDDPVLVADPTGRRTLGIVAERREMILIVSLDDSLLLGEPDRVWIAPLLPKPGRRGAATEDNADEGE